MSTQEAYLFQSDEFADRDARKEAIIQKLHQTDSMPDQLSDSPMPSSVLPLPPITAVDSQPGPGRYTGTDV